MHAAERVLMTCFQVRVTIKQALFLLWRIAKLVYLLKFHKRAIGAAQSAEQGGTGHPNEGVEPHQ